MREPPATSGMADYDPRRREAFRDRDDIAAFGQDDAVTRHAPLAGGFGVTVKLARLAVERSITTTYN